MRLKEKVAVIPGGTSGIGKEIALRFIKEGATVVVASRGKKRVQEMQAIFDEMKHNGCSLQLDISNKDDVDRFMKSV